MLAKVVFYELLKLKTVQQDILLPSTSVSSLLKTVEKTLLDFLVFISSYFYLL